MAASCAQEQSEAGVRDRPAPRGERLDERRVSVRPVRTSDLVLIQEMHGRLSKESVYLRYLAPKPPHVQDLERMCFLDGRQGMALVATVGQAPHKVVATACYCVHPGDPSRAEPAVLVEDAYQGQGLGKRLFLALCQQARLKGVEVSECFTHLENHRVLGLIRGCGLRYENGCSRGVREIRVRLKTG